MRLDQNPVHRKAIFPWYDSEAACYIGIGLMLMALVFGLIGVRVACETAKHCSYVWIPGCLVVMSAGVMLSIIVRLIRRYLSR
ncbi:MAG: hypothetical protein JRE58_02750 [Deltaproteobacteria bacterium]|nr:hypothetical protein [Deltaproteobacteria bacterium]MBW2591917.1 hypothetical protein [Deltaproteobacteria bacterium]